MRARVYSNGGNSTGGFTFNGGVMTGALYLAGNPSEPLEAAAKQYIDSSLVNISASNIATGILPTGRLPSFTGDLIKPAGSSTINIAPTGVAAGDFVKPTINAKGLVTGGGSLLEADIPNLSWDKISLGRPTTMLGYGITDGFGVSGGTLSGFLTYNGVISTGMQAATKQYIDVTLSSATGISIGDVIRKPFTTTPSGFLKCNGAEVSKTTYSTLYSVIGDRFSKSQVWTSGRPWVEQYNINETQSGDLTWIPNGTIPDARYASFAFMTKNRVYFGTGWTSAYVSAMYYALINADGTLGPWVTTTSFPFACGYAQAIVIKKFVYVIGAWTGGGSNTVYYAPINADGSIGAWGTHNTFATAASFVQPIVTNNRIYICGGNDGSNVVSTVWTAPISSSGVIGTWATGTSLPVTLDYYSLVITKNRVYLCGGLNNGASTGSNSVYTAVINSDGTIGVWSVANSLPYGVYYAQSYVTKNKVYLIGGHNGSAQIPNCCSAPINTDGTIGTWKIDNFLPTNLSHSTLITTKGKIHLLGGHNGSGGISTIHTANISGGLNDYSSFSEDDRTNYFLPGNGKPWQQQFQYNTAQNTSVINWTASGNIPSAIGLGTSFVTKNRVYYVSGSNGSGYVGTVQTAPINADGTLGTWTIGTAIPATFYGAQAVLTKNRVYVIGGNYSSGANNVWSAPINSDGTVGTWVGGPNFPITNYYHNCIVTKNRLYVIGGYNGASYLSSVYYAMINPDGTIGAWNTGTSLPIAVNCFALAMTKNRIHLVGGWSGSSNTNVYSTVVNSDGSIGTWTLSGTIPNTMNSSSVLVTKNKMYLFGGDQGSSAITNVITAGINTDGTLGAWTQDQPLAAAYQSQCGFATSTRYYLIGNWAAGGPQTAIYSALINGVTNDYSPYYDGTVVAQDGTFDYNYMMPGSARPWVQQYQINMSQASDLTWTAGPSLPVATNSFSVITTKNRVYGFFNGPAANANIYTAVINSDGTIGTWSVAGGIGVTWGAGDALVIKNKVYLIGGGWNGGFSSNAIYVATINADGTLGTFALSPSTMPYSASDPYVFNTNSRIYIVGGYNGSYLNYVYSCPINTDGTLGAWIQATNFPSVFTEGSVVVTKNRVYLIGGYNGSHVGTIYTAPIQTNGFIGAWSSAGSLPSNVHGGTMYTTNNRVYIIGGSNGVSYQNTVYYAPIDVDGTIGAWTAGTAYPEAVSGLECISTSTKLYAMGGYKLSPTGPIATVYQATITGGLNDVSPYYDGSVSYTDANIVMASTFFLPDLSQSEKFDSTSYIKY